MSNENIDKLDEIIENVNNDKLDEIIENANKFMEDTIREYKDEIEKYSLEIDCGNDTVLNYAYLFLNYRGLYEFTKKERKYRCVDKSVVDNICEKFLSKVQEEMAANQNMSENYCHLATIYSYKGDNTAALEFYDKAVELDSSKMLERGEFKSLILHDIKGALEDYNQALENARNAEEVERIQFMIDHIDLFSHKHTGSMFTFGMLCSVIFYSAVAAYLIYICYRLLFF